MKHGDCCHRSQKGCDCEMQMVKFYRVEGMRCNHCKMSVENALKNLNGVESVAVDLSKKSVAVKGKIDEAVLKSAIEKAGFEFAGEMK